MPAVPATAVVHMDFVAGFYWMNGAEVALGDIIDLNTATLGARGVLIESGKDPFLTAAALGVVGSLLTYGLTQVITWDADTCNNNRYAGPAMADDVDVGAANNGVFCYNVAGDLIARSYATDIMLNLSIPAWMRSSSSGVHKVGNSVFRYVGNSRFSMEIASEEMFASAYHGEGLTNVLQSAAVYFPFGTVQFADSGGGADPLYAAGLTILPAVSSPDLRALVAV